LQVNRSTLLAGQGRLISTLQAIIPVHERRTASIE